MKTKLNTSVVLFAITLAIESCAVKKDISTHIIICPKIVAHCGYWDKMDSCPNSISSLLNAGEIGVYATEFDVHITKDDVLVICHDTIIKGVNIHDTLYEELHNDNYKLSNGEFLPNIDEYFTIAKRYPNLHLMIELKSDNNQEYEHRALNACVSKIQEYGMQNRITFISFSLSACIEFNRLYPSIDVFYLNGDKSPKELYELGIDGMDYHYNYYYMHPEWIREAYQLGLKVAAWTVDDENDMNILLSDGVEYLATNKPSVALSVLENYRIIDF